MPPVELRDLDIARQFVLQGLVLQRVAAANAKSIQAALQWSLEIAASGHPLPPVGFVADLGHILMGGDGGTRMAGNAHVASALPGGLVRAYEDFVLGKFFADGFSRYGWSKLMSERMLADVATAFPLRYVALRYFNVAGADPGGRIGQSTPEATHLIKVACEHAVGKRERVEIFGTDYDTPDGTCVRDYIHVEDLAGAHLKALDYLRAGEASTTLNCGYGSGFSVREVLDQVAQVAGRPLRIVESGRRAGDPPRLVARAGRIRERLGWQPRHQDIGGIVRSALAWEQRLLRQPAA